MFKIIYIYIYIKTRIKYAKFTRFETRHAPLLATRNFLITLANPLLDDLANRIASVSTCSRNPPLRLPIDLSPF